MSPQRFESHFHFRCPQCGSTDILAIEVPEFNFNVERMSDLYAEDQVEFVCPSCEYEFAGDVVCTPSYCEITVDEPTPFTMTGDPPMFSADPADAYDPPSDPYALLAETIDRCLVVAEMEFEARNDPQFLQRMALTTIVTALETFLSDTFLNLIKGDQAALGNLVARDGHFSAMKIPLFNLVGKPDFASLHVRRAIQEIPFHNLPRVEVLYKAAIGLSLSSDEFLWARLNSLMKVRHDCVHRNGHTAEGERRDNITTKFVHDAASDCRCLADYIEGNLSLDAF